MDFKVKESKNPNRHKYSKEHIDIAYDFSRAVIKEFGTFVKSVVLFGSTARHEQKSHDIDILIIVDDVSVQLTPEMVEAYRVILDKIAIKCSRKLHITTLKMTSFWDYVRKGDPLGLNILRDGVALYDLSLFDPLRILLAKGKVMPSIETRNIYLNKSMGSLFNARNHILQATLDLYWAVIDMSHAVLMQHNVLPETPSHVADRLQEHLVDKKLLEKKYVETMRFFYILSKKIIHHEVSQISGSEFDSYAKKADEFITRMKKLITDPSQKK
ncbi:MAG: nucleotidyltransferase domain-containing protein [Candidatus Woesearchaeota archaeon]